jgi:hypothetical protein
MTEMFRCGDHDGLIDYLYDECEPVRREVIAAHVAVCSSCAAELAALGGTQQKLAAWHVPDATLGFRLPVEPETPILRPSFTGAGSSSVARWRQPLPAWAQVAAAALIFASGLAAGMLRSSAPPTVTVVAPPAALAVPASVSAADRPLATNGVSAEDLTALERRLRAEMAHLGRPAAPVTVSARGSDDEVMRKVHALLAESEQRQHGEMTLRLAQLAQNVDKQRQVDLRQVQWTVGQLQELTGAAVRDQDTKVKYLMNSVSLRR